MEVNCSAAPTVPWSSNRSAWINILGIFATVVLSLSRSLRYSEETAVKLDMLVGLGLAERKNKTQKNTSRSFNPRAWDLWNISVGSRGLRQRVPEIEATEPTNPSLSSASGRGRYNGPYMKYLPEIQDGWSVREPRIPIIRVYVGGIVTFEINLYSDYLFES